LKKNTAFIKKARIGLNAENQLALLADIKSLSLEKYLSEVVSAIAEGLGKVKSNPDILAATEVVSALHQRFGAQFTSVLAYHLVRALAPSPASYLASLSSEQREKDESSRVNRQRNLLKVVTELWLVGVLRTVQDASDGSGNDTKKRRSDEALPLFCLRELLTTDKEFTNLSIATSFAKHYPECFDEGRAMVQLSFETAEKMVTIFQKYYDSLASHLQRQNEHISREQSRLEDSTVLYGTTPTAREGFLADMQKLHDKQIAAAQILSVVSSSRRQNKGKASSERRFFVSFPLPSEAS
jgi:regulator of nonsense transcripts 2